MANSPMQQLPGGFSSPDQQQQQPASPQEAMMQQAAMQLMQQGMQLEQAAVEHARMPEPLPELPAEEKDRLMRRMEAHVGRMHQFRRQQDARRAYWYRQFIGSRDPKFYPDGVTQRSNVFVPYPLSNVETLVSRTLDAFFSIDPWFETRGRTSTDDDNTDNMQLVLQDRLKRSNFTQAIEELVRNICIYGHAGIKVDWDYGYDTIEYKEPVPSGVVNPQTGQPFIFQWRTSTKQVPRMRPRFYPVDIYDMLIDPDKQIVAHMVERTWGELQEEFQANPSLYYGSGMDEITNRLRGEEAASEVIIRMAEVWSDIDHTMTLLTYGDDKDAISWKDARSANRGMTTNPWKRQMFGGGPVLLYHGQNPFKHQKNAVLHTSFLKLPGEVFGMGAIEMISDVSEGMNRMVNMITDNWNLGINHRYGYDINMDIDHQALNRLNVPGGKVAVNGDPSKALLPLPFFTPNAQDYMLMDVYRSMIELASGVSDFYAKGMGTPGSNRTSSGINQVISESGFRFKMFIRNMELDVLQPLLKMCASMVQQFITDDLEVAITGQNPTIEKYPKISPEQLIGSFDFDIVAGNYATNKIVRQRNLLAFANLVMQSPYVEQYSAIKELAKVFEIKQVDKMLKTPEQVGEEQQQQQQQMVQQMILEKTLDTESKIAIGQSKPAAGTGGTSSSSKRRPSGGKVGRPRRAAQLEGKIPGSGFTGPVRSLAQSTGLTGMGLEGLGESGSV